MGRDGVGVGVWMGLEEEMSKNWVGAEFGEGLVGIEWVWVWGWGKIWGGVEFGWVWMELAWGKSWI